MTTTVSVQFGPGTVPPPFFLRLMSMKRYHPIRQYRTAHRPYGRTVPDIAWHHMLGQYRTARRPTA
eukprot:1431648-Rhodomonas_salina.2